MKSNKSIVLIVFTILIMVGYQNFSTSQANTKEPIYFGYFWDSLGSSVDYTKSTKDLSNVHWIYADADIVAYDKNGQPYPGKNAWPALSINPTQSQIELAYQNFNINCNSLNGWNAKLQAAVNNNHKIIVDLQRILFAKVDSSGEVRPVLSPDYKFRFSKLLTCIQPYAEHIVGFNIFDEPYFNNAVSIKIPASSVANNIYLASALVKKIFPTKKNIISIAFPDLDKSSPYNILSTLAPNEIVPSNIDWYGIDCYLKEGQSCNEKFIAESMTFLNRIRKPGQSLILFPDATYPAGGISAGFEDAIIKRNNYWLKITKDMPIAGYFPFIYKEVVSMPKVRDYLKRVYNCTQKTGCVINNLPISSIPLSSNSSILRAGFLKINGGAYHSFGNGKICGYKSITHMNSCGEIAGSYDSTIDLGNFPVNSIYFGTCECGNQLPASGLFKDTNGSAYRQISPTKVCGYNSMEHLKSCGEQESSYISAKPVPSTIDNLSSAKPCGCGNQVLPAGFFKVGVSAYHSDGAGNYCGYTSVAQIESCGETKNYYSWPPQYAIPSGMNYTGVCSCN